MTQVLNDRGEVPLELSALLINCALSAANAELLLKHNKGKTLKSLIKRGLKTKDALIMKVRYFNCTIGDIFDRSYTFIGEK